MNWRPRRETTVEGVAYRPDGPRVPCKLVTTETAATEWSQGPRADPHWTFRDAAGHEHAAVTLDEPIGTVFPSLIDKIKHVDCGCEVCEGDGYEVTVWHCRECDEVIEPGLIEGPYAFQVEGPTEWRVITLGANALALADMRETCAVTVETTDGKTYAADVVFIEGEQSGPIAGYAMGRGVWEVVGKLRDRAAA